MSHPALLKLFTTLLKLIAVTHQKARAVSELGS
jgi:hypothetical protein